MAESMQNPTPSDTNSVRSIRRRNTMAFTSIVLTIGAFLFLAESGFLDSEIWERDNPLSNPLAVAGVQNGIITLTDGRTFQPAGVERKRSVTANEYDRALRAVTAQGVVIIRDLGDGRAFLLVEPKFFNWCGTRGDYAWRPWAHFAGYYAQCPLSELLVFTGYAQPELTQPGLTPRERWRLEGTAHMWRPKDSPTRISQNASSLSYESIEFYFGDYEGDLAVLWKPPPP